jgi:hypothetical protein
MDDLNRNNDLGTGASDAARAEARRADDMRRTDGNAGDEIGEAVGGISGVLTGAALGSLGGPIGTIIGGIAGAVSGWWAGRAISEAASHTTNDDDEYYRTHYESAGSTAASRTYDDVRPAYHLGHIAGRNPDYKTRSFDEVETDLRHGWTGDVTQQHGQWNEVRDYARHGYERARGENVLERGAHKAADLVDDMKDRVDGNPSSRPGADATDASRRTGGTSGGYGATGGATGSSTLGLDSPNAGMGGTGASIGGGVGDALTGGALGGAAGGALGGGALGGSSGMGSSGLGSSGMGGAMDRSADALGRAGSSIGNSVDDMKDRIDGNPASRPGLDRTDSMDRMNTSGSVGGHAEHAADRAGNAVENVWDKTKNAAHRAGEKIENALDDTKDRVDGNPASRPGLDRTDDRDRLL